MKAQRPRTHPEFLPHGGPEKLVLRVLEDVADARQELRRSPPDRAGSSAVREQRSRDKRTRGRWNESAERQSERRLADPVAAGESGGGSGVDTHVDGVGQRLTAASTQNETGCGEQGCAVGNAPARWRGHGVVRKPDAGATQGVRVVGEHRIRGPVGKHTPIGAEHDHPIDEVAPHGDAMLDHHERGTGGRDHRADGVTHLQHAFRVEVRGRLIEQQEPWAHGENTGEREALLLAARQRRGWMVER